MKSIFIVLLSFLTATVFSQAPFVTTWKTDNPGTSNNTSITIPTNGPSYRYDIDWESDGIYDDFGVSGNITHDYKTIGTYQVSIRGDFPRIYFNNSGDSRKIISIDQWGDNIWSSMANAFFGASNLQLNATDFPKLQLATDLSGMFRNAIILNASLDNWEVGTITDMSWMFYKASAFNGALANWDVSNVNDMTVMFQEATSFNGNISTWNVTSVSSMQGMFKEASSFNNDISGWTTTSLNNTSSMFQDATSFNQDIGMWNTENVTTMSSMFLGASEFNQSLGNWNIESVDNMISMLLNSGINQNNYDHTLIGWAAQNIKSNVNLGAGNLEYCAGVDARETLTGTKNWSITGDSQNCYFKTTWQTNNSGSSGSTSVTIPTFPGITYDYDVDWNNDGIFDESGVTGSITHNYQSAGIYTIAIRGNFPRIYFNNNGDKEKILSIDQWGDISWQSMGNAFYGCTALSITSSDQPDLSQTTDLSRAFFNATNLDYNFGDWNISSINNMTLTLSNTNLSTENYDNTLIGWFTRFTLPNVELGVHNLSYCLSEMIRNQLIQNGWSFSGDSKNCDGIDRPLIIRVKTDNPGITGDNSFRLPTNGSIGYNFDIDWNNDGIYEDQSNTINVTHSFPSPGEYTVAIRGDFPHIYFNNEKDVQKLISIEQWGDQVWTSMNKAFHGATNLQINATDTPNLSQVERMSSMFNNASALNSDIGSWNVSTVKYMDRMFSGAKNFNQDLSSWNFGNVQWMNSMFQNANAFDQNLGTWNITSVTNMYLMLTKSGLSIANYDSTLIGWAAQNVNSNFSLSANDLQYCAGEDARNTLINTYNWNIVGDSKACTYFLSVWKTDNPGSSNSTSVTIPVFPSSSITYNYDIDWENDGTFDTLGVTGEITHDYGSPGIYVIAIRGQFPSIYLNGEKDHQKIIRIDQWGDIQWERLSSAFRGATNLAYAAIDTPDLSGITSIRSMFEGATIFNADLRGWDVSNVTDMSELFKGASSFNGNLSDWNVSNVSMMLEMFNDASSFNQDIGMWNVQNVNTMKAMFSGASSFNQDLSAWNVLNVTDMSSMFKAASSFNGDISTWSVDNVNTMRFMFQEASIFNQDLNLWDVEFVTNMGGMFQDATSFDGNITNWPVNNVSSMRSMFRGASSFNRDIGDWIVNSVTSMSNMFWDATSFDQNLGDWDIANVSTMNEMLRLSGLSTSNYDSTLIGWAASAVMEDVTLGAFTLTYCNGENARNTLVNSHGWVIQSDSKDCSLPCGEIINTWTGPSAGLWNSSASNWSEGEIPTTCHQVLIPSGKSVTIPQTYQATCFSIEVEGNASLTTTTGAQLECTGN